MVLDNIQTCLGQIATRDYSGWLIVDAGLETGRTPVNELDCALDLDGIDIWQWRL